MAQDNYVEWCSMQRPLLLEPNGFYFWKARFETYIKSKDIDLWQVIQNDDFYFEVEESETKLIKEKPYELLKDEQNKAKVTASKEAKYLTTLPLDDLIGNLKVYETVLRIDGVASKPIKDKIMPIALKANTTRGQTSSDIISQDKCDEDDEINLMAKNFRKLFRKGVKKHDKFDICKEKIKGGSSRRGRDCYNYGKKNHFIDNCPKSKRIKAFVGGAWSDSDDNEPQNDVTCLVAFDSQKVLSKPSSSNNDLNIIDLQKENEVIMDDPNITMEEYIRLEEEKARRRGKVYNWETAIYGKIWCNEDVHDLRYIETEFPSIVFDDAFTSEVMHSYEPKVSLLNNNKIDFRISFNESDDEDYTVIFDKNSFSYKVIFANDLKTDLKCDEEDFDFFKDLDLFKDFENEFAAIVYNDALASKSDFLTEPIVSPDHIDEFDFKSETSLSECDKEEQNVLYFKDLFSFNVIYPEDSKSNKDNDDDKIDIEQSSGEGG
ncbi:hypothetical protein Tco_0486359 [Tanacetum coccineum]